MTLISHVIRFRTLACLLLLVLAAESGQAQTPLRKLFGFGFSVGEPMALTLRMRTGNASSIDAAVGKSALGYPRVHGSYLWQFTNLFSTPVLSAYAGLGALAGFGDTKGEYFLLDSKASSDAWFVTKDVVIAGRGTLGFNIFPRYTPLEVFVEVNPVLGFIPEVGVSLEASIGIRVYP